MLFLSGFEVYSRWVPLTVNNYLAVMLWFVLHTSMTVFFYDYGSCQASLNLLLISLAYLLTGKRYTSGESPNFGIEIFYGILRKFRRVAMVKWSLYSGRHDPWFAFQRLLLTSEQGWFFLMRLYFLTLLSKITEKTHPEEQWTLYLVTHTDTCLHGQYLTHAYSYHITLAVARQLIDSCFISESSAWHSRHILVQGSVLHSPRRAVTGPWTGLSRKGVSRSCHADEHTRVVVLRFWNRWLPFTRQLFRIADSANINININNNALFI